ncbi:MAG: TonB-dependent receptor, partial [Bryobacterales bacterium]|nr:TonB-dependent receptor [Bryobacterales bacterium]
MFLRCILICLLACLAGISPLAVSAQTGGFSLAGSVTDPDGAAIAGATVLVLETSLVATTDAKGEFAFSALAAGRYTLRVTSRDFDNEQIPVEVGASGTSRSEIRLRQIRAAVASVEVVGEAVEAVLETPGSLFVVSRSELRNSHPMDANEVLRRVPGVVINDNSGPVATRLNIGIRGLNPDRSRSVLVLEDGLPVTLAPYGEPETYYSPSIDRMDRVEVVKGSGQVLYGPQTVGGVVNFITPDPPSSTRAELNLQGGQRGYFAGNGLIGGSSEDQRMGWLVNFLHKRGDGFRDFFFNIDDLQTKFVLKPTDRQTFSVRGGYYDENSNSTYLGLTTPMFLADPNQNPVPSDFLKVKRVSGSVGHTIAVSPTTVISSSLFGYSTVRDWARADFDRSPAVGRNYWAVFGDTSVPDGALYIRNSTLNRDRSFDVFGAQTGVSTIKQTGAVSHAIDAGIRYIGERMNDKNVVGGTFDARTGVIREDENRYGSAFSAFIQDRIRLTPRLTISPGIRLEHYNYDRHILVARVGGVPSNVDIRGGDG